MLNTESRVVGSLIWLAVLGLFATFVWHVFAWPSPAGLVRMLLDSELASFVARNQTVLAGLLGFGGLALGYLFNGWRDRTERRHVIERAERRDARVLAREASDLAVICEAAARQLIVRSTAATGLIANLRASLAMRDHMLLAASAGDLARLGAGASSASRTVRASVHRLVEAVEHHNRDDAQSLRGIAARALESAFSAREAGRVFETLARSGPMAADRVRLMPPPETSEIERLLGPGEEAIRTSRLLPAA